MGGEGVGVDITLCVQMEYTKENKSLQKFTTKKKKQAIISPIENSNNQSLVSLVLITTALLVL